MKAHHNTERSGKRTIDLVSEAVAAVINGTQ
ncbi:hypothetical protein OKW46_001615 [Paraburkholderia sp. WSM4179]|nr:hypothetical protein [Paraburkholderia sp. MM5384-R2]MDH6147690.1 hypothetical protein [Paraburkholderia sp. WSM4179]